MKIALLGDIALFGNYSLKNNPKVFSNIKYISDYLLKFDLVVGNLETPFTTSWERNGAKSGYLGSDPINIEILKKLNISILNLANNHIYDFGHEGLETTISILENANIKWFGVKGKDLMVKYNNNNLRFSGYCCYSTNPLGISKSGDKGVNPFHLKDIEKLLKHNREEWLDIISVHSGIEHINYPSIDQIMASRKLAGIAPYIWYGHHPHMVQGIEKYASSILAHSLGNFIFSNHPGDTFCPKLTMTEQNRIGMILEIEIENNTVINYNVVLTHINEDNTISFYKNNNLINRLSTPIYTALDNRQNYENIRYIQRNEFVLSRKKMRDFKWFFNHLKFRYVKMVLNSKSNNKKYFKYVKSNL